MQKRSVRRKRSVLAVVVTSVVTAAMSSFPVSLEAQSPQALPTANPRGGVQTDTPPVTSTAAALPLLQEADLAYLGGFRLPRQTVNGTSYSFGGKALAYRAATNSLYVGTRSNQVAEVNIPTPLNSADANALPYATFLQPFADPTEGHLSEVGPVGVSLQSLMVLNDRLYGNASVYYDAQNEQKISHFSHSLQLNELSFSGWTRVWDLGKSGFVSGFMSQVPSEWQPLLGGPAVTGQCCIPIVSRTSMGPAAFAFNPSEIGQPSTAATPLVYYPTEHPTLGLWSAANPTYGSSTEMGGMQIINGTRTALYFGRNGIGPNCYGLGTSTQALHGTLSPEGEKYCYDPTDSSKGTHGYPYRYQMWAYDLNDFAAVKAGTKQPWDVIPYGVWELKLPTPEPSTKLGNVAYDAERQILYVSQLSADQDGYEYRAVIHALQVTMALITEEPAPPPAPVSATVSDVTLVANKTAPQETNVPVTFTATPEGGTAPHQYKWFSYAGGTWTAVSGWSDSDSFTWMPAVAAADARVGVWVRSAGNTEDAFEATANKEFAISGTTAGAGSATVSAVSLTSNKMAPQAKNTTVTFTATPAGGVGPHQYKWFVFNNDGWTNMGWSASNTFAWTPAAAMPNYRVGVWVRSAGNSADALEASAETPFEIAEFIAGPVSAVTLSTDMIAPQAPGTVVTWSATPVGGTAHQYKWFVYGTSWEAVTGWTSSNTFAWAPTTANPDYRVGVWVKKGSNTADALEASAEKAFVIAGAPVAAPPAPAPAPAPVVAATLTAVTITANVVPVVVGQVGSFTAVPAGGAGPHQYKWWVYDGGAWTTTGWTSSNTFAWTPTIANLNQRVGVWVKSAGNAADALEAAAEYLTPIR
jgi:hypothetical protein